MTERNWHDPAAQQTAALDYAETALSECWIVLRDIAAGHKYPARYAANLLEAHGHNLDGQVDPTPHVCQFCETPLTKHWWDPCTYTTPRYR